MTRTARHRAWWAALLVTGALLMPAVPAGAGEQGSRHAFDPLELSGVEKMKGKAAAGARPAFTWSAVEGATEYTLVVQNLKGRPYWAWRGPETAVFLGGVEKLPANAAGPLLTKPAQWQVVAYGPDGAIVGATPWRVVRPS